MDFPNHVFLIVGAGKSGQAAAKFLAKAGAKVYLTDLKKAIEMTLVDQELKEYANIQSYWGFYPDLNMIRPDTLIVSPGVPLDIPLLKTAANAGIEIIGELELAYRIAKSPLIAITGTNGKTTTTALIGQMFLDRNKNILIGGNIGQPLIDEVSNYDNQDLIIAEVSSFQLETISEFKPRVSVILNITPDHLDRHLSMENYIQVKANVFRNQTFEEILILNYDDPVLRELATKADSHVIFFSREHNLKEGVFLSGNKIYIKIGEEAVFISETNEILIRGNHNLENAMAAIAVGYIMGLKPWEIKETLQSFPGVSHRLEYVSEVEGVKFINDSKGTNPAAAIKALDSFHEPIVLIAGGKNKGNNFADFAKKITKNVKSLVLVGQAAAEIEAAVREQGFQSLYSVKTFPEAVQKAYQLANKGDIVLLSPGCASWDMFDNFEQRGDLFKKLVAGLKN